MFFWQRRRSWNSESQQSFLHLQKKKINNYRPVSILSNVLRGDAHMTSSLRRGIALWPDMLSRILIYYWQGIFLLTLAKLFEANWQWRGSLMIPLHCLSAKSNNKTRGQFECGMTWFCFCFDFIGSHAREGGAVEGMRSGVRLRVGVEGGREGGEGHMCIVP